MIDVTEATFNDLANEGVVLLDFHAPWCGPCRALAPILGTLENVTVLKVNIDENQGLATRFKVDSIPKLVILKDGEMVSEMVGLQPQTTIQGKINEAQ